PVPITRRSRRVLALTYPGAFAARVYAVHEAAAVRAGGSSLVRATRLRQYFRDAGIDEESEFRAACEALGVDSSDGSDLAADLRMDVARTFRALEEPGNLMATDLTGGRPMNSLRDVEAQAPIVEFIPGGPRRR
ncbi:MAG: helicase, partial [Solirubrobacterales bacterium]|nr:helicase [Solirubrobacterales bacterium]